MIQSRKTWLPAGLALLLIPAALFLADTRAQEYVVQTAEDDEGRVRVYVPAGDAPDVVYVGEGEHFAYLGVQLEEETDYAEGGARVTEVVDDSPAERAGIKAGDIIVGFDGKTIRGPVGLTKQIHATEPGSDVSVTVVRDGREQRLNVELADRADVLKSWSISVAPLEGLGMVAPDIDYEHLEDLERSLEDLRVPRVYGLGSCDEDEDCGFFGGLLGRTPKLGVQLAETTPELKEHLGSPDGTGVLVSKVLRGLPAEHAGVQVGDLIVRVAGEPIEDVSDLRRQLRDRTGQEFTIEVIREKRAVSLDVSLPEVEEDEVSGPRAFYRRVPPAPDAPAVPRAAPAPRAPRPPHRLRDAQREELREVRRAERVAVAERLEAVRRVQEAGRLVRREALNAEREALRRAVEEQRRRERELRERIRVRNRSITVL
jgi:membrane-associated protease RseP (regulator of RpoE activity)